MYHAKSHHTIVPKSGYRGRCKSYLGPPRIGSAICKEKSEVTHGIQYIIDMTQKEVR